MMVARPSFAAALCLFLPCSLSAESNAPSGTGAAKTYMIQISGTFPAGTPGSDCIRSGDYCVVLTDAAGVDITPSGIKAYRSTELLATISYGLPDGMKPAYVYLGRQRADQRYAFVQADVQDPRSRGLLLSGDFCDIVSDPSKPNSRKCSKGLLESSTDRASFPEIEGYVTGPEGIGKTTITVNQLSSFLADVSYTADPGFQPTVLVLMRHGGSEYTFTYRAAPPEVATDVVYLADNLEVECFRNSCEPAGSIKLKPFMPSTSQTVTLLSREKNLLFTHISSQAGELPEILTVELAGKTAPTHLLARRVTKPASDQSLLSVEMTVMDQETVRKNFGAGIAEHYLAVNLDAANRTGKKLQFNKSAIWFDVDYQESSGNYKLTPGQRASMATLDLIPANVYLASFSTDCRNGKVKPKAGNEFGVELQPGEEVDVKLLSGSDVSVRLKPGNGVPSKTSTLSSNSASAKDSDASGYTPCSIYRFGIEQNKRVYPGSYMSVLNSFDYATEKTDRILRYVELFGGLLNTIAGGGYVGQVNNFAFRDAASILAGNFLPAFRTVTQDTPGTDRLRANLVNETFQETVQLAPNGHGSTVVLLPRDAILATKQDDGLKPEKRIVVIRRVIDVHIDPDVLNGVKDANVPANVVDVGYSKEQVRQSLGEPAQVKTNDDGTSVFTYTSGAYQTVNFNADGRVVAWDPRTTTQQIVAAPTLDAGVKILREKNVAFRQLTLWNGNSILADVPGVTDALQYDVSLKHMSTNYQLRYVEIRNLKGKTKDEFEKALGPMKLPQAVASYSAEPPQPTAATKQLFYVMPDIKGGTITVTFDGPVSKSKIKSIEFGGEKPPSVVSIQP